MFKKFLQFYCALNFLLLGLTHLSWAINCKDLLTTQELRRTWKTIIVKGSERHPLYYYNLDAVNRVISDPDLKTAAKEWMELSVSTSDTRFVEATYKFLINLGEARNAFGYNPGASTPLLDYLRNLIQLHQKPGIDLAVDLKIIEGANSFFHRSMGIDPKRKSELMDYVNKNIIPRIAMVQMMMNFQVPHSR